MTDLLTQLAALAEKATAAPWEVAEAKYTPRHIRAPESGMALIAEVRNMGETSDHKPAAKRWSAEMPANAALIVLLRNSLPAILAMGKERDALRACIDLTQGDAHMLKKAIEAGDPKSELLFRANDIEKNCLKALEGGNQ